MKYIGINIHKKNCVATIVDKEGEILKTKTIPTNATEISRAFRRYKGSKAAIESNTVWEFVYEVLSKNGIDVILTNAVEVKAIAHAKVKTDKVDSKTLAHLLRTDMLPISYIAPIEVRELRKNVRGRMFLKKVSTGLKNQLYAELTRKGIEYPKGFLGTKMGRRKTLELLPIPRVKRKIDLLNIVEEEIAEYNHELLIPAYNADPNSQLLATIPGVGYYTALTVMAFIGRIDRFKNSDALVCYSGLVSRIRQTGESVRMGPITKAGPTNLRWVMAEAVQCHLMHCKEKKTCNLCKFFHRINRRRGKQKATIATAAKMLRIMYWMLKLNQPYRPQGLDPGFFYAGKPRVLNEGGSVSERPKMSHHEGKPRIR
jgi:transposase